MVVVFRRYTEGNIERGAGGFWLSGDVLDPTLNLTDVFKIIIQLDAIVCRNFLLQGADFMSNRIENAAGPFPIGNPFVGVGAIAEQPLECHTRIDLGRQRSRRSRPGNGVRVGAAIAPIAVARVVTGILDAELNGWQ